MQSIRTNVILLFAAALTVACGSSKAGPSPAPTPTPTNSAPVIGQMAVSPSGYRLARISATTSDTDGQIASATVDWGDGETSQVTSGFANLLLTHLYDRAQSYTVTLRVVDDKGAPAQLTRSVTITVPPEACIGILIVELCARSTADFRNLQVAVKAGDIVLASTSVTNGNPSISLPLAGGFGRLTLAYNFSAGRLTITGEVCPIPFVVCEALSSRVIQF